MLVLTRRVGEKLVIGNEIVVEILAVSGEGVRVGIVAPRETSVHRFEVFEEIQEANRAAEIALDEIGQTSLENLSLHVLSKQKTDEKMSEKTSEKTNEKDAEKSDEEN